MAGDCNPRRKIRQMRGIYWRLLLRNDMLIEALRRV
jgi:hypothetical protein